MREARRHYVSERSRPLFQRGADGRLKAATEELELADVWADQQRLQLAETLERQKVREAKKHKRRELGRKLFSKKPARLNATSAPEGRQVSPKEIEIKISMPHLSVAPLVRAARRIKLPRFSAKQWAGVAAAAVLIIFIASTQSVYNKKSDHGTGRAAGKSAVAGASAPIGGTQPEFTTVLPAGKTIKQLGGWGRVSPPDKNPVFGYSDSLSDVHIVVSEQPLPADFAGDLTSHLVQLAKQFDATGKLTAADGSAVYLGTATSGAQSVICSKNNLLILLRSSGKIGDQLWVDYINTLQ